MRHCDCTNNSTTHQRIRNSIYDNVYIGKYDLGQDIRDVKSNRIESQRSEEPWHLHAVSDTSISTVASSPLVTLISRLASPYDPKHNEKAEDP